VKGRTRKTERKCLFKCAPERERERERERKEEKERGRGGGDSGSD